MSSSNQLLIDLLDIHRDSIIPLTKEGIANGCKVFGAAILRKSDHSLVIAATNDERQSPLLHGEINCIQQYWALPKEGRPLPKDCIFYATHEPCSLCLSGITWSGFDNFYYFYTYEDTRDAFSIPYDIQILEAVYKVPAKGEDSTEFDRRRLYNKKNSFFTATSIAEMISSLGEEEKAVAEKKIADIKAVYEGLNEGYQKGKGNVGIPLA